MARKFTLYWSSLDRYEKCPQAFLWYRGWGAIDVGGGPGRKKPIPTRRTEHHALMGTVIQAVIEDMYNQEWWRHPRELVGLLEEAIEKHFTYELSRRYIDWRQSPTREELRKVVHRGVMGYLRTFKQHKIIGPFAKCEQDYVAYIDKYNPIGGRIDFLIRRDREPNMGVSILDGKNSKEHWDRSKLQPKFYLDSDQLRWYAMCFYLATKVMPDRVGYIYFRYPFGHDWADEVERYSREIVQAQTEGTRKVKEAAVEFYSNRDPAQGIEWIPFTKEDLKGLAQRALEARKGMDRERFDANPSPSNCRFCDYVGVCPQRQAQIDKNRKKRMDPLFSDQKGAFTFSLGDDGSASLGIE